MIEPTIRAGEVYFSGLDGWQPIGTVGLDGWGFVADAGELPPPIPLLAPCELTVTVPLDGSAGHLHHLLTGTVWSTRCPRRCWLCNPRGFTTPPSGEFGRHYNQRRKARRRRGRR